MADQTIKPNTGPEKQKRENRNQRIRSSDRKPKVKAKGNMR